MSDEEKAINLLQSADIDEIGCVQWHTWYKGFDKDIKKAFDMAIKALEQEHCEDLKDALYIAQTDRDKWVARAKKLAKIIGIRDCDIDEYEQEPCKDCISREKAKQFLYERLDKLNDDELYDIFSRIIDDMYNELPSVTPQPFINKPCVSEGVCREDKIQVLDKIRAEIKGIYRVILKDTPKDDWAVRWNDCLDDVLQIIDKYKESEGKE